MDSDFLTRALSRLKTIHLDMRKAIAEHAHANDITEMSRVARISESDTIYAIDESCEEILLSHCERWGREECFVLIAEGIGNHGQMVFPSSASPEDADFRLIVDPIDGTRGIMYDKRSAWILSGIAPNRGNQTCLSDIELAIQTEVPLSKQYLADMLFAVRGRGAKGERMNLISGDVSEFYPSPSRSATLKHGFAMLTKFFPGRKQVTAAIEEELLRRLGLLDDADATYVFDDQYISTGGQFYELAMGHDRFSGDFRAHLMRVPELSGNPPVMAAHPYDLCTELIAREAGVIVTDIHGQPLDQPLDVHTDVSWIGYANEILYKQIEPVLQAILSDFHIIDSADDTKGQKKP
ncbi:inositol monophosphatase [candidate division KSB1 bacterium]|nr:inositol monophosphatase [candidate division KSB1 bacterium]